MSRYMQWLQETGLARHVLAILLCSGITWEWGLLGSESFIDYSLPAQGYFRAWLRGRYGTEECMAEAWGRPGSFAGAAIPSAERRARPHGPAGLRPLPDEQDVIDYQQCLSDMNADLLLQLAAAAKDAAPGGPLVGAFYGYTLTARDHNHFMGTHGSGGLQGGHHALGRVLRSPHIDFLASPFSYANRELGSGYLQEHAPLASVHRHGKAFFDENDIRGRNHLPMDAAEGREMSFGEADTEDDSIRLLHLAFAQCIVRGKHQWITELGSGDWYASERLRAEIQRLSAAAGDLLHLDRSPVAEVAYVIDEQSAAYLGLDHRAFRQRVYFASVEWGHLGAPYDLVLLDDLLEGLPPRCKLVVPACVKRSQAIQALRAWREKHPATMVLWDASPHWYPPPPSRSLPRWIGRGCTDTLPTAAQSTLTSAYSCSPCCCCSETADRTLSPGNPHPCTYSC